MAESTAQVAADWIWDAWERGEVIDDLPPHLKPQSRDEGYAIQACLMRPPSDVVAGWKIAATSAAGQSHIGVDGPLAGRIFENRVVQPGATLPIKDNRMRVCEPEFAFRLGADVAPREQPYTVDEVMARVGDLHLAFELPDSRFKDFAVVGGPTLIADNACARDLVVGPAVETHWRTLDLSAHAITGHVAGRIEREGNGANVLGDPRVALTWLVNELSALGETLLSGQFVTTGTTMVPMEIVEGDDVMADFGVLGQIQAFVGV